MLQASIDSWSLIEPPGWIIAVIPALWASSTQSENGKNASDASAAPFNISAPRFSVAWSIACLQAQILLTCPGPTPIEVSSLAIAIPFDFAYFTTF